MVANFSDEQLIIPKATVLGVAEEITEERVNRINPRGHQISDPLNDKQEKEKWASVQEIAAWQVRPPAHERETADRTRTIEVYSSVPWANKLLSRD